ncbi:hypothetical protein [Pararhodobacter sp. SW119]|uniref:hypothetical protein n=1 Tax=Pararhodobacter sp. SW119 TaxID=2780075 RepID=UPI001AE03E3B|nr:hypothetical protein [Pararhodobacter sp. SW119]
MNLRSVNIRRNGAPWQKCLKVGDVVLFEVTLTGIALGAMAVGRPCLVIEVGTVLGGRYAVLASSVAAHPPIQSELGLLVQSPHELRIAGLQEPTFFLLSQQIVVPLNDPGFLLDRNTATPRMGCLERFALERLTGLLVPEQPAARVAPGTAQHPGRGRSRRRRTVRPFVVERRSRKKLSHRPGAFA